MYYQQIKAIYKLLKTNDKNRPALSRMFEQGGHLWATNGYVAFDICEVKDEYTNICMELDDIKEWLKGHKKYDMLNLEDFKQNDANEPVMTQLVQGDFEPADDPRFDIELLQLCTEFLEISAVKLMQSKNNHNLLQVLPCSESETPVMLRALGSKAYIMQISK